MNGSNTIGARNQSSFDGNRNGGGFQSMNSNRNNATSSANTGRETYSSPTRESNAQTRGNWQQFTPPSRSAQSQQSDRGNVSQSQQYQRGGAPQSQYERAPSPQPVFPAAFEYAASR